MNRPFLFAGDLIAKHGKHPFSGMQTIKEARKDLLNNRNTNIFFLIEKRYSWMNKYIKENDKGIELGCGTGIGELHIKSKNFELTDVLKSEWITQIVDAHKMPFENSSLDFIIINNAIHHLSKPIVFLKECSRVLRKEGKLLIQDSHLSLVMRILINIVKHEGYSYDVDVFDPEIICNDSNDPWSANLSLPDLLFADSKLFAKKVKYFKIDYKKYTEFFIWPLSGGVASIIPVPNINRKVLEFINFLDNIIISISKNIFPLQQQIVLSNKKT
ncbi:MAG: class I SAM-dependent methyltransferase [SAR202 cluster bacterium]|nr:class I SAM-dependent methyltransferase [SAR202 cluster bacterium]